MTTADRRYCEECGRHVLARRVQGDGMKHHSVLALLTCGLWLLPAMILMACGVGGQTYRCEHCGSKV